MSFAHPSAQYPTIPPFPPSALVPRPEDEPKFPALPLGPDGFPPIVLGCATFGWGVYANPPETEEELSMPLRVVRLALKDGITMFDTSPHYHPSEAILGNCLAALASDYPRSSYKISTKCGRYSSDGFDYSPSNIEASVRRSLRLLQTSYVDIAYLHDVEFISDQPEILLKANRPADGLKDDQSAQAYGLRREDGGKMLGAGDEKVIKAYEVLVSLKEEGLIRDIGISGYPLPTLLRLSRLLASTFPSCPPTSVLSYAHSNLANNTFPLYVPSLLNPSSTSPSGISNELPSIHKMHLLTASPLSMGLLVPGGVPAWHPVRVDARNEGLVEATRQVGELVEREWKEEGGMVDLALGFGLRNPTYILDPASGEKVRVPVMVGAKNVEEVRAAVRVWNEVNVDDGGEERRKKLERRKRVEEMVRRVYVEAGWEDVSWASPQSGAVGLQRSDEL